MSTSKRHLFDRLRRWLGWINDDREMEREADVDQARTTIRDATRDAAVHDGSTASDPGTPPGA